MILTKWKLIGSAVLVIGAFVAGWQVKGAFVAESQLEAVQAAKEELVRATQRLEEKNAQRAAEWARELKAARERNAALQEEIENAEFTPETDDSCYRPVDTVDFDRLYCKASGNCPDNGSE